jgi:hypothetical protein
MDLHAEIVKAQTKVKRHRIADYVGNNSNRFKVLIEVYHRGPYRTTQRASGIISLCVEKYPALIKPHLQKIITMLDKKDVHDAVLRNTMRLLQYCEIPKRLEESVINKCFYYLEERNIAVAIKAFAMTVLFRLLEDKPSLKKELRIILENDLPVATPGFVSRARKIIQTIDAL